MYCCIYMHRESDPQLIMIFSSNSISLPQNKTNNSKHEKQAGKVLTYFIALVFQAASQQRIAAFMAQTQSVPAKLHRGSKAIDITASARPAENGANGTSSISHARSATTPVSMHDHS